MKLRILTLFVIILLLAGCGQPAAPQPTEPPAPQPTQTELPAAPTEPVTEPTEEPAPLPEASPTTPPEPTATQQPTAMLEPTSKPFVPFTVRMFVDNVNLRSNPGYLFPVLYKLMEGDEVEVQGMAPGGEWLYVKRLGTVSGWVFAKLVETSRDLQALPLIEPEEVQLVSGRLLNTSGTPISGVQFAVLRGIGAEGQRTDASTDVNGEFYAFLPLSASGPWRVSYTAIACTSNVMDASCNFLPGAGSKTEPETIEISLPYSEQLQFTWQ